MTIEFQTPYGKVPEKLISQIRNKILELTHINKKIRRAEVLIKEEKNIFQGGNKICEISLSVFGDNLFAHARTENFEESSKEAINTLKRLLKQQEKKQKSQSVNMPVQ